MKKLPLIAALFSMGLLSACNTFEGMGKDLSSATSWTQDKPSTMSNNSKSQEIAAEELKKTDALTSPAVVAAANDPVMPTLKDSVVTSSEPLEAPAATTAAAEPLKLKAPEPAGISGLPKRHGKLVWHQIQDYDAQSPTLPGDAGTRLRVTAPKAATPVSAEGVKYNDSVKYFPLDGDTSPYATNRDAGAPVTSSENNEDGYMPLASSPAGEPAQKIYFAHSSTQVGKMDRRNLHELAASLVQNGGYRLDIVGHASKRVNTTKDPVARKMINFRVAQKRAAAVALELKKAGLSPDMIVATSQGDEQPAIRPRHMSQEAADRRADVFVSTN